MQRMVMRRTAVAILVGVALCPTAAAADNDGSRTSDRAAPQARGAVDEQVVLRRDGDRAVPVDPVIGSQPALRRDGSLAVPFLPSLAQGTDSQSQRFQWGDAAIGAVGALGLILLASMARAGLHRRRPFRPRAGARGLGDLDPVGPPSS